MLRCRPVLPKEPEVLRSQERDRVGHDRSADHRREDRVVGLEGAICPRSVVHPPGNRVEEEDGREHAGRIDPRPQERQDVEESGVHEHERRKCEREPRLAPPNARGAHAEHNHNGVGDVEGVPLDRQLEHPPGPVTPIVFVLLKDVYRVCGGGEPQEVLVGHWVDQG